MRLSVHSISPLLLALFSSWLQDDFSSFRACVLKLQMTDFSVLWISPRSKKMCPRGSPGSFYISFLSHHWPKEWVTLQWTRLTVGAGEASVIPKHVAPWYPGNTFTKLHFDRKEGRTWMLNKEPIQSSPIANSANSLINLSKSASNTTTEILIIKTKSSIFSRDCLVSSWGLILRRKRKKKNPIHSWGCTFGTHQPQN